MPARGLENCVWVPKPDSTYAEFEQVCPMDEPAKKADPAPAPVRVAPRDEYIKVDKPTKEWCEMVGVKWTCW